MSNLAEFGAMDVDETSKESNHVLDDLTVMQEENDKNSEELSARENSSPNGKVNDAGGAPKPVKLPYFHRVLSKEDQEILGNCAPTPITGNAAETVFKPQEASSNKGASAWNSAGTWEEKNCTEAAKKVFENVLEAASGFSSGGYYISVDSIKEVSGNAQITHVRGKARYLYDFSCNIKFVLSKAGSPDAESAKATVKMSEIINDSDWDDYAFSVEFKKTPADSQLIKKALSGPDAKKWLKKLCVEFEAKYKEL